MERFIGKVAVVTGASRGIGEAISKELVKRGLIVAGLARDLKKLQALSDELSKDRTIYVGKFHPLQCDVSKDTDIRETFKNINEELGPISILVNNAGVLLGYNIDLQKANVEDFHTVFNTNVKGLLLCAKEAMNSMTENSTAGHIININSIAGLAWFKNSRSPVYSASKHAARVFSEAWQNEVTKYKLNIKISNIYPGIVDTDIPRSLGFSGEKAKAEEFILPKDIADVCISVLDTSPNVLISDITVIPIHESPQIQSVPNFNK